MSEECACGFEAKNPTGLAAHQRACDEYEAAEMDEESFETPPRVSNAVAEDVFQRDDEECVRCESTDGLTIHRYDEEGEDIPQNLVLVCADCDDLISGGHPLTKRTQISR